MLTMCIDAIIQKVQQNGALIQFEKFGPDPSPPLSGRGLGHYPLDIYAYLSSEEPAWAQMVFPVHELVRSLSRVSSFERHQLSMFKYVFVMNSGMPGTSPAPFGYLKAASNLQSPLKKAFERMTLTNQIVETENMQRYSYNIISFLAKLKHVGREDFEALCTSVSTALQQSAPPPVPQVTT
uniref:Uncharacterized protein n=1 Tax=Parascaris equorum TaxID=6256 RepID=A0A914RV92_PAREQ